VFLHDSVHTIDREKLVEYVRTHAVDGRWAAPEPGDVLKRGGRPLGSGRFHTRAQALRELRLAYLRAARELEEWREVRISDLARVLRVPRSSIYWWFGRFNISLSDLT
jgi:hypothetical protein